MLFFAQSVYLIFSAVYICKETVEHLLLSVGDGHHHHPWDEAIDVSGLVQCLCKSRPVLTIYSIQFPLLLIIIAVISLTSTSLLYENHNKLLRSKRNCMIQVRQVHSCRFDSMWAQVAFNIITVSSYPSYLLLYHTVHANCYHPF